MNDTSPKMEEKMREMIRLKSPTERLQMGWSMYETSKLLVIYSIREDNPTISKSELRKEIFLRFYRDDFTLEQREKILAYLERNTAS